MTVQLVAEKIPTRELARHLGKTEQSVNGYLRRGMPCDSFEAAEAWIVENIAANGPPSLRERETGERPTRRTLDEAEQLARIAKLRAEAKAKELKNSETEGRLIDAEDIGREVASIFAMLAGRIEDIPDAVIREIPDSVRGIVAEVVTSQIHLALKEAATAMRRRINAQPDNDAGSAGQVDGSGSDDGRRANGVGEQNQKGIPDIGHSGD